MNEQSLREIHREVGRRSDMLFEAAVKFADEHKIPRSNQFNGLLNVVNSEQNTNTILSNFVQHQATKSTTNDAVFWTKLKSELDGLRKAADEIQNKIGLDSETKKDRQKWKEQIHLWLIRDYVQHLVAHLIYRSTQTGGE
jgi:hypothetical protein